MFFWDYYQARSWCSDIKNIFEKLNLQDLYQSQSMNGKSLDTILRHTFETYEQMNYLQWTEKLQAQPKLRTYRDLKNEYICENYVKMFLPKHLRSFIAQVRTGTLPLRIETGRFRNLKIEERLCEICNLPKVVETEYHFLFQCIKYSHLRLLFYNYATRILPDFLDVSFAQRLKYMLTDKRLIKKSAIYIQNCYLKRSEIVYSI